MDWPDALSYWLNQYAVKTKASNRLCLCLIPSRRGQWPICRMLKTFSIIALVLASMHFVEADPENGSYDEYMRGALIVYSNEIVPSLDNSVEFLEHLNDKWKSAKCSSSCYQTGYLEAKTFIAKREGHGSKIR